MHRDAPDLVLLALASTAIARLAVGGLDGTATSDPLSRCGPAIAARLTAATRAVLAGWWPPSTQRAVHLSADPTWDDPSEACP